MSKKAMAKFEFVGWVFWAVTFALLVGPAVYGAWQITREGASPMIPIAMGVVAAALAAGVVSWAINSVLQWRYQRRRLKERKKSKRGK